MPRTSPLSLPARRPVFGRLGRLGWLGADVALAGLVILVVGLMIVPLPTWALDLLISANLSAAVAILLVVLYVPGCHRHRDVPDALLLTTPLSSRAQRSPGRA